MKVKRKLKPLHCCSAVAACRDIVKCVDHMEQMEQWLSLFIPGPHCYHEMGQTAHHGGYRTKACHAAIHHDI